MSDNAKTQNKNKHQPLVLPGKFTRFRFLRYPLVTSIFAFAIFLTSAGASFISTPSFQAPCDATITNYCVSTKKVEGERRAINGSLWSPTIGWIKLNHGTPNFEVTISLSGDDRGHLYGYGWSAVFGWVNFEDPGHKDENGENRSMVFVDPKNADLWAGKAGTKPDGKTVKDALYGNLFAPGFGFIFLDPNNNEAPSTVTVQSVDEGKADGAAPSEHIGWVFFNTLPEGTNQLGQAGNEIPQSFDITFDATPPSKIKKDTVLLSYDYHFKDKSRGIFKVQKKIDDTGYINISNMQAFEPGDKSNPDGEGASPIQLSFELEDWSDSYKVYYEPITQLSGGEPVVPGIEREPVEIPYQVKDGKHIFTLSDDLWTHSGDRQLVNLQIKIMNFSTKQATYDTVYIKNHKPVIGINKNNPFSRMSVRTVNKQTGGMGGRVGDLFTTTVVIQNIAEPIKAKKYCYNVSSGATQDCDTSFITGLLINDCANADFSDDYCKDEYRNKIVGYVTVENDLEDVLDERFPNPFMELAPEDVKVTVWFSSNDSGFESRQRFIFNSYKAPLLNSTVYSTISESDKKDIIWSQNFITFLPGQYKVSSTSFDFSVDHSKSIQLEFSTRAKATP